MTREELKAHCEKQIEMCEMWAMSKGEKPSGKIYEEHKLILELLEQEPTTKNDLGVDCVSRQFMYDLGATCIATRNGNGKLIALGAIEELPSVTPQEPIIDKIRAKILDNAFSVVNPYNTYEEIYVIDLDSIDEILDVYKAAGVKDNTTSHQK